MRRLTPLAFLYTLAPAKPLPNPKLMLPMLSQSYLTCAPDDLLTRPGVLAVVAFNEDCAAPPAPGLIPIGVRSLSGQHYEVISYGNTPAERGSAEGCHWSVIDDVMCAVTWLSPEECTDIEAATQMAYRRLLSRTQAAGFAHPFRIWNFMAQINQGEGDGEAYKKFCVGRQLAFDSLQLERRKFPAASALGHHSQGAVIYLLAHRQPGRHHENPRQEPAYKYPRQYGPCSPSFARATSLTLGQQLQVFISGTASILGHDTRAAGDLQQQLAITLENIHHLTRSIDNDLAPLSAIRVYLRHAADFAPARDYLARHFPPDVLNFLHADICRDNLLVEIEAATHRTPTPA